MPQPSGPSLLALQEYFSAQDSRFLELIRQVQDAKALAAFADRWKRDGRAWARAQIFAYLEMPLECPGHQPLVKRLFKHAEQQRDGELLGAFMTAFDRLIRRRLKVRHHWDYRSRRSWKSEHLITPATPPILFPNPKTLELFRLLSQIFSNRTRLYLRRRAWRYFRRMGFQNPAQYVRTIADALKRYRDDDIARGENILDCWGLMHACFFRSDAIRFTPDHANLKPGANLTTLSAAPAFEKLWKEPSAGAVLLQLVDDAKSRLVRVWAIQLFRRDHKDRLAVLNAESLLNLLDHPDEEVQQFGAELLEKAKDLDRLPVDLWLRLLKTRNLTALEMICQLMLKHVSPDRLKLAEMIELACDRATPVARMGFGFLQARPIADADARDLAGLADARCPAIGQELASWALSRLSAARLYEMESAIRFFDSTVEEIREGAWEWLKPESPGYSDSALFSRLLETPYEDLRLKLIDMLQKRSALPGRGPQDLAGVWCAVLLGIHRGGRHKLKALTQISGALRRDPADGAALIPIIAIAIRSVRSAEARPGLAALVSAAESAPQLVPLISRFLPELDLLPAEVAP